MKMELGLVLIILSFTSNISWAKPHAKPAAKPSGTVENDFRLAYRCTSPDLEITVLQHVDQECHYQGVRVDCQKKVRENSGLALILDLNTGKSKTLNLKTLNSNASAPGLVTANFSYSRGNSFFADSLELTINKDVPAESKYQGRYGIQTPFSGKITCKNSGLNTVAQ